MAGDPVAVTVGGGSRWNLQQVTATPATRVDDVLNSSKPAGRLFIFVAKVVNNDPATGALTVNLVGGNWRAMHAFAGQPVTQTFHYSTTTTVFLNFNGQGKAHLTNPTFAINQTVVIRVFSANYDSQTSSLLNLPAWRINAHEPARSAARRHQEEQRAQHVAAASQPALRIALGTGRPSGRPVSVSAPERPPATWSRLVVVGGSGERRERLARREQAVLVDIVRGAPLGEVLDRIVLAIEEQLPDVRASILLLDRDGRRVLHGAAPTPRRRVRGVHQRRRDRARRRLLRQCDVPARAGGGRRHRDRPALGALPRLALRAGLRACWSTPILGREAPCLGSFAIYHASRPSPRLPTCS